jgi:hypothetical protein
MLLQQLKGNPSMTGRCPTCIIIPLADCSQREGKSQAHELASCEIGAVQLLLLLLLVEAGHLDYSGNSHRKIYIFL